MTPKKHEFQIKLLSRLGLSSTVPHALLLTGPDKSKKVSIAVNFIKWISVGNMGGREDLHGGNFVDFLASRCECVSCFKIDRRLHPDFVTIESPRIKIEEVRDLRSKFSLSPIVAPIKSAIIFNAGGLSRESANALLKFLEEPRGKSLVFLIAQSRASVLETISSRALEIRFSTHDADLRDLYLEEKINEKLSEIKVLESGLLREKFLLAQNYSLTNKDELMTLLDIWMLALRNRFVKDGDIKAINLVKKILKTKKIISETNANPQILLEELALSLY